MRLAILTATRHGETAPIVLQDASVPIVEQKASYKSFALQREHPEYCEVQLWTSDGGIIAKRKLKLPQPEGSKPGAQSAPPAPQVQKPVKRGSQRVKPATAPATEPSPEPPAE